MTRSYVHKRYRHGNDEEMAALYAQGMTTYEIGERFGVSPTPVTAALKRQGVQLRRGGKPTRWMGTAGQCAEVVRLYGEGVSVADISSRLGCRSTHITEALEAVGIARKPHGAALRAFTDEQAAAIALEYQAGVTANALAAKYGVTNVTINNYLEAQGVQRRPAGVSVFWTDARKVEVAQRYAAGESQQQIADSLGCQQTGVSNALRSLGISTRQPQWAEGNPQWKGGRVVDGQGYIRVKVPAEDAHLIKAHHNGYVMEHRLVMARKLGRKLKRSETVHHIDGDKTNNSPENLQVRQGNHGNGIRVACLDCGSDNIGPVPLDD